jgi:nicotinamide riboside transporter PnuC
MSQEQRAAWEKTRSKGKWRFIFLYGVVWWATFMNVGFALFNHFFREEGFRLWQLWVNVPVFTLGGFLYGLYIWGAGETAYKESLEAGTTHAFRKGDSTDEPGV